MFEEIEKYYKKNSRNIIAGNVLRKWIFIFIGSVAIIALYLYLSIQNKIYYCIIMLLIIIIETFATLLLAVRECNRKIKETYKLNIFNRKKENSDPTIIDDNEIYDKLLMKKYIKKRKFYNIEMIKNIIDYYREKHNNKIDNYLTILTIIISLIAIIFSNVKIDIICIILFIALILLAYKIVYKFYESVICLNNGLNEKQNIYESLDEIFSEILNEYIIESKVKKKINNNL